MTQIILNIEDDSMVPHLKEILRAIKGITIEKSEENVSGLDLALKDVEQGRVTHCKDVEDMIQQILGE